ncbi:MAG: suppressor of glycerol defect [Ramalina farinacea]|uniref:Suppressor of glycerol defect n=1 Tax=Ramalina farinacea TaxID=258253 RepID=A0AA43QEP8_9LECA|nr:suppressor of glycerol defect [Ramalina farinacea]
MSERLHETTKLPKRIADQLGILDNTKKGPWKRHEGPSARKEQRKAARHGKKLGQIPPSHKSFVRPTHVHQDTQGRSQNGARDSHKQTKPSEKDNILRPISKKSKVKQPGSTKGSKRDRSASPSADVAPKLSKKVQASLAEDDAEIHALERALGVKDRKKLPKSFEEEGLSSLLDGLSDTDPLEKASLGKRERNEGQLWLQKKRRKIREAEDDQNLVEDELSDFEGFSGGDESWEEQLDENGLDHDKDSSDEEQASTGFNHAHEASPPEPRHKIRENPYIAPPTQTLDTVPVKYVPPSKRHDAGTESEDLSHLRRRLRGLLNRFSESNLLSIVREVETFYQNHARQHVSETLIDILLALLADPTLLSETFIILHAAFIAALYKVIGNGFGAQIVRRVDEIFSAHHELQNSSITHNKVTTNLISLIANLYVFQVISSRLIFDYVRACLKEISENNTELLLKIVRIAGPQLRQEDSSALKGIVSELESKLAQEDKSKLSVRTAFMIESINKLRNNRMKTGASAALISSELTIALKKIIGSLNQGSLRAREPLGIGLKDIRDSEARGEWWLIGASWKDQAPHEQDSDPSQKPYQNQAMKKNGSGDDGIGDNFLDGRELGMNTEIRRAIYFQVTEAEDYNDAYARLKKLSLKKHQEQEIPKVLIRCSGAGKVYNPYYTLLSRRLCSERNMRMSFQFSLWDLFKRMGEGKENDDFSDDDDDEGALDMRAIVNLGRLYGTLIAEGSLSLGVLRNLNLAYLQQKGRIFVELLLITVMVESQQGENNRRDETAMMKIFLRPKEMPEMANGLHYFIKKVLRKSRIAGSEADCAIVKWGCNVVADALATMSTGTVVDD